MVTRLASMSSAARAGEAAKSLTVMSAQVVGVAGCVDVALDVLRLLFDLVRLDREPLHRSRNDAADDHRGHEPQAAGDQRKGPAPEPDVDEHQDGGHQRDADQQLKSRLLSD